MIGSESVRSILIALFAVLGAGYLAAMARALLRPVGSRARQAVGDVLHVLMSAAMIAMVVSPAPGIPTIALVTAFTAAAGWFGGQALFGLDGHHGEGVYRNWFHAGMMAVMVWMAVAMDLAAPPGSGGGMGGMPMAAGAGGMVMSGQAPAGALATASAVGGSAVGWPGWAGTVCAVLAVVLLAAAAWQAVVALRPFAAPARQRPPGSEGPPEGLSVMDVALLDGASALMAAGMAVALLEMA